MLAGHAGFFSTHTCGESQSRKLEDASRARWLRQHTSWRQSQPRKLEDASRARWLRQHTFWRQSQSIGNLRMLVGHAGFFSTRFCSNVCTMVRLGAALRALARFMRFAGFARLARKANTHCCSPLHAWSTAPRVPRFSTNGPGTNREWPERRGWIRKYKLNAFVRVPFTASMSLGRAAVSPLQPPAALHRRGQASPGAAVAQQQIEHFWAMCNLEWPDTMSFRPVLPRLYGPRKQDLQMRFNVLVLPSLASPDLSLWAPRTFRFKLGNRQKRVWLVTATPRFAE